MHAPTTVPMMGYQTFMMKLMSFVSMKKRVMTETATLKFVCLHRQPSQLTNSSASLSAERASHICDQTNGTVGSGL